MATAAEEAAFSAGSTRRVKVDSLMMRLLTCDTVGAS